MKKQILHLCLLVGVALFLHSCKKDEQPKSYDYSPRLPQSWMQFSYDAVKAQGWFALDASRLYAYASITAYESMVHGLPKGRSLAGQLKELEVLPTPEPGLNYDYGIVLCHAMPQVLLEMMPDMGSASRAYMDQLARSQEITMRSEHGLDDATVVRSKEFADELAEAIINWSRTDRRNQLDDLVYIAPNRVGNPQFWDGTTLGQTFMMPYWWTSRSFVGRFDMCEVIPPYPYSTSPSSVYYKDVKEVYDASFDPAKVAIGRYWANNPGQSGTPAGSWLGIANQLVNQFNLDLPTTLRMYVLLTVGTRDTFISVWYSKYKYNLERPVSYIRNVMGHTSWSSPVPTPPYPDYVSGTSANAGVSSNTLARLLGEVPFQDDQHLGIGLPSRSFSNFYEAGVEAFHSRIYGGVHMRRACEVGFSQGRCISDYLLDNLKFEK